MILSLSLSLYLLNSSSELIHVNTTFHILHFISWNFLKAKWDILHKLLTSKTWKKFLASTKFQIAKLKCDKMKQKNFPEKSDKKGNKKKKADFFTPTSLRFITYRISSKASSSDYLHLLHSETKYNWLLTVEKSWVFTPVRNCSATDFGKGNIYSGRKFIEEEKIYSWTKNP